MPPAPGTNATPSTAQFIGKLASREGVGDEVLRLGYEIHGQISTKSDVDVYAFTATPGTEVWFDIDRTSVGFDSVVELIDDAGNVLVRSDNSFAETDGTSSLYVRPGVQAVAKTLQKDLFQQTDFYSSNPLDAGFRVTLPGTPGGVNPTYKIRVRSSQTALVDHTDPSHPLNQKPQLLNGETSGSYQLQIRLRELDEVPGSTIRYADIRDATNAIELYGLPGHSPLLGEVAESTSPNENDGQAQNLGNLLGTDRGSLSVGGNLANPQDVDWYAFTIDYGGIQNTPTTAPLVYSTLFDIDYADAHQRADTILSIYDNTGRLVLMSRDSSIVDDLPDPLSGNGLSDLAAGSLGVLDPQLGTVNLPEGQYFVAISSNARLPGELNQFLSPIVNNPFVRLEPLNTVDRIAEDHIGSSGGSTANDPAVEFLLDASVALVVPSGVNTIDGETFTIIPDDSVNDPPLGLLPVTFEFDDDFIWGAGNIRIPFNPNITATQLASDIAAAVNLALGPTVVATANGINVEFENILGINRTAGTGAPRPAPGSSTLASPRST